MTTDSYETTTSADFPVAVFVTFLVIFGILWLALVIPTIVGLWKVFEKAGKPGWGAVVPFYNYWLIIEIVGRPEWWLVLLFVPYASLVVLVILMIDLAKSFGRTTGFGVGLALLSPVFMPLLGFGSDTYGGPSVPPPLSVTPAGWYADPWRQAPWRYWDGRAWTPHTA